MSFSKHTTKYQPWHSVSLDKHTPAVPGDVTPIVPAILRFSQYVNKVSWLEQQSYCLEVSVDVPVPVLPRKSTAAQSCPKLIPTLNIFASKALISPKGIR